MDFRQDINALRAVAVVAVVLFHFEVFGFGGGFVGVDVFFVISGYLMSGIVIGGIAKQKFSLLHFYVARMRRIVPALLAMGAVLLAFGWWRLTPHEYALQAEHIAAALAFVSNVVFKQEAGYFDAASHEKWMLHSWSLSVEWQFYLVFPLIVLALVRWTKPRGRLIGLVVLALASFVWAAYRTPYKPESSFFLLNSRAWEMFAGAIVWEATQRLQVSVWRERFAAPLGLAAIVASLLLFDARTPWPGFGALLPVIGAALVLMASQPAPVWARPRAVQALGRWSYSIYLWHWPLLVAIRRFADDATSPMWLSGVVASVALGALSYRLIEQRQGRLPRQRFTRSDGVLIVLWCVAMASALWVNHRAGLPGRYTSHPQWPEASRLAAYEQQRPPNAEEIDRCLLINKKGPTELPAVCFAPAGSPLLLMGDSHAVHLVPGLWALRGKEGLSIQTGAGCPPLFDWQLPGQAWCRAMNDQRFARVASLAPQHVVLAGAWQRYPEAALAPGLRRSVEKLRADGVKHIVLVGPVATWPVALPKLLAERVLEGRLRERDARQLDPASQRLDALLRGVAAELVVDYYSPRQRVCNANGCLVLLPTTGGVMAPMSWDYGHLTLEGSSFVVEGLLPLLR
jgi:peptidoglycan/LPS O-acetylase OafA/YrhL